VDLFHNRSNACPSLDEAPVVPLDDEVCLAIVFTSGTTGSPKGVVLSRRAFLASARASAENLRWYDDDRWLLGLPMAHVGGLSIVTRCLIARKTVVVPAEIAEGRRLETRDLAKVIESQRVTLLSLVPTQLEWLVSLDPPWRPPPHLRAVLIGGAPARPALLERAADLGIPVLTTYGLTEACSQVTTQPPGSPNRGDQGAGLPLSGTEVHLTEHGVIKLRGPTLLSGYFPDAAAPLDDEGWFETDDVGRFDDRGMLHVVGRRSERIITGGENVYPAEVEAILEQCPQIAKACVFGVPDDSWGEVVAVVVVPTGKPDIPSIIAFAQTRLAAHRRPRLVAFAEALSTAESGKLDRRTTAALARERLRPMTAS
jgi:O-succinylbenzoic acid--CoA ligase